jgi:hypothetical protein
MAEPWWDELEKRVVDEEQRAKQAKGMEGYESLGRLYGAFVQGFKQECGASERVAADVLIAYIETHPTKPRD